MVLGNFQSKFADGHELGENREEPNPNLMGAGVAPLQCSVEENREYERLN